VDDGRAADRRDPELRRIRRARATARVITAHDINVIAVANLRRTSPTRATRTGSIRPARHEAYGSRLTKA
jgi:hypothetical protein